MAARPHLLIAGNLGGTNVGDSFFHAAKQMALDVQIVETHHAFAGPRLWRAFSWRLLGHRPSALHSYNGRLREAIARFHPAVLLATGLAPITAATLLYAKATGVRTINYLTDDPWNPGQRSRWFLRALPNYDVVFSPRRLNIDDLRTAGCSRVEYLPFAYDPRFAHSAEFPSNEERSQIVFAGGADVDRVRVLAPLLAARYPVALYGSYWERFPETRNANRGQVGPSTLCRVTAAAKIALCLVRRANRDGHVMRTFEIAAIGACMLAEDTSEHRAILGDTVVYFRSAEELVARAAELLENPPRRAQLAAAARDRIRGGRNTYADRLREMLSHSEVLPSCD